MKCYVSPTGSDFIGAIRYDQRTGKAPRFKSERPYVRHVGGNATAEEMQSVAAQRPTIKKPVQKFAISLPPNERLSGERWHAYALAHLEGMGLAPDNFPFNIELHRADMPHEGKDKGVLGCEHIHITVSRIGFDGAVWYGQYSQEKAAKLQTELEKAFGLTPTPGWKSRSEIQQATPTPAEINKANRTQTLPPRMQIQQVIDEALRLGETTWRGLAAELALAGIDVYLQLTHGNPTGVSFLHQASGMRFSGMRGLGALYSTKTITARLRKNHHEQISATLPNGQSSPKAGAESAITRNAPRITAHNTSGNGAASGGGRDKSVSAVLDPRTVRSGSAAGIHAAVQSVAPLSVSSMRPDARRIDVVSDDLAAKKRSARQAAIDRLKALAAPHHPKHNTPAGVFATSWLNEPVFGNKDIAAAVAVLERFGREIALMALGNITISPNYAATLAAAGQATADAYVGSVIQSALRAVEENENSIQPDHAA